MKPRLQLVDTPERAETLADRLAQRAYHPVYRPGQANPCPGCGRNQWHVGRTIAECAFCEALVPLAPDGTAR